MMRNGGKTTLLANLTKPLAARRAAWLIEVAEARETEESRALEAMIAREAADDMVVAEAAGLDADLEFEDAAQAASQSQGDDAGEGSGGIARL